MVTDDEMVGRQAHWLRRRRRRCAEADIEACVAALDEALSASAVEGEIHRWVEVARGGRVGPGVLELYLVVIVRETGGCGFVVPLDALPASSVITSYSPAERDLGEIFEPRTP